VHFFYSHAVQLLVSCRAGEEPQEATDEFIYV